MKTMQFKKILGVVVIGLAAQVLSACTIAIPDRAMRGMSFIGPDKYVQYVLVKGAMLGQTQTFSWVLNICDIDAKTAKSQDCVPTTVIDNVATIY